MRTSIVPAAALLLTAVSLHAQEPRAPAPSRFAPRGVIDGTGAAPIANGVVVVTDDKIVAVGKQGR